MAQNAISSRRVDQAVSGFLANAVPMNRLVMNELLPTITVGSLNFSGTLWSDDPRQYIASSEMIDGEALRRAPSAPYPETGNYKPLKATYECKEYANKDFIPEVLAARSTFPLAEEQRRSPKILNNLLMQLEVAGTAKIFNTADRPNTSGTLTALAGAANTWDGASADVARTGHLAKEAVRDRTGNLPNKACITYDCLKSLRYNNQLAGVRTVTSGTGGDNISSVSARGVVETSTLLRILADLWEVEQVFVINAQKNSAKPKAAKTLADVATASAVFYCDQGISGGSEVVGGVNITGGPVSFLRVQEYAARGYRWNSDDPPGTYIAAAHSYDLVVPAGMADTAYVLTSCLG